MHQSEAQPKLIKVEGNHMSNSNVAFENSNGQDVEMSEERKLPQKVFHGLRLDDNCETMTVTKV